MYSSLWWKMKEKVLFFHYLISWNSQNIYTRHQKNRKFAFFWLVFKVQCRQANSSWDFCGSQVSLAVQGWSPCLGLTLEYLHGQVKLEVYFCLCCFKSFSLKGMICQASLSITNSRSLPKLMSIESVIQSGHLILCHPLLLLPPMPPRIKVFSDESTLPIRCQSIGVSASASVLPMNTQDWSPLEWTGWISLQSKGLSRVFSNTTVQKHQFFSAQPSSQSNSSHPYMTTGKTIALTRRTLLAMSLLFNILSRLVITFLPRSKHL